MVVGDLIRLHEGLRLKAYDDETHKPIGPGSVVEGHPTIGYGRALDVRGVSKSEAEDLLDNDIEAAEAEAAGAIGFGYWNALDDVRQAALTDMAFNLGQRGLDGFVNLLTAVRKRDWLRANSEVLESKWARDVGTRASHIASMFLTGQWPDAVA